MIGEIINLLEGASPEVYEAVTELLKALREAEDKELDIDPIQVLKNSAELISGLSKMEDIDLSGFTE